MECHECHEAGTNNSNTKSPQSNKKLADKFADYFSTAVRKLKMQSLFGNLLRLLFFHFDYVSRVFIGSFLKKLKRNKSAGLDELPPGMLKDCREYIVTPLHHIVNLPLQTKIVPQAGSRKNWSLSSNREIEGNLETTDPSQCCQFSQSCWRKQSISN